ncbi:MAG TPA: hypothetical protein VLY24_15315 [Bryobacteraceae bacterium]|nr:hypothetical protein [Bryobacteraceae bacterium]
MRPILIFVFASSLLAAPAPLAVVRTILSDTEGGAALPKSYEYTPGETIFFSCRIAGFRQTAEEKIHLTYSVDVFDPAGVPLVEHVRGEIVEEVTPQDREWMPKIASEIAIPPLIGSGTYTIVVKVEDLIAKANTELKAPFPVRARSIEPSDTLTARNFRFLRSEEDEHPLEKASYRPGDTVWARFDIIGFQYGPKNRIDVGYVVSILDDSGKVLWTQPDATTEQSESFYPKRYISASLSINIQKNTQPGTYAIGVQVKDGVGTQTYETKETFTIE